MSSTASARVLTILSNDGRVIGTATIEHIDMGVRIGEFKPSAPYGEVRPVFLLFARAVEAGETDSAGLAREYYRRRDALSLRVVDEQGVAVPGVVHIVDLGGDAQDLAFELYPA